MQKAKEVTAQEFAEILPKHHKYLIDTLCKMTVKLFTKICNNGLYHYLDQPRLEGVGITIDLNPQKIHSLQIWAKVGKDTYKTTSDVCPPYVSKFDGVKAKSPIANQVTKKWNHKK